MIYARRKRGCSLWMGSASMLLVVLLTRAYGFTILETSSTSSRSSTLSTTSWRPIWKSSRHFMSNSNADKDLDDSNSNQRKRKVVRTGGGDGTLAVVNTQRVQTAGRRGTKSFVDPTKLFLGNLPFQANETDVLQFFKENLGSTFHVKSVKIIRDWKTHNSKGYGFCLFSDPIYATSAVEQCKNRKLMGRIIKLSQGLKKRDPNELYIKKKKKKKQDMTDEELAIDEGLEEAEGLKLEEMISLQEFDDASDADLFGDDQEGDDEDFEYDGIFEELYPADKFEPLTEEEQNMNREKRREAARRKKRRKLPRKGFESQPDLE